MIGTIRSFLYLFVCLQMLCLLSASWPARVMAETGDPSGPWDKLTTPFFHHLSVPKDLPSAGSAIVQDQEGFIWIGTQGGLVRWDGYRPKVFRHDAADRFSLPHNLVNGLVVDKHGALLVATSNGVVSRFDPDTEHFLPLPATNTGTAIYASFIQDSEGGLWLGNANGLSYLEPNGTRWEPIQLPNQMRVWTLLSGHDGSIWAGTDQGLVHRLDGTTTFAEVKREGPGAPLLQANIRSLLETESGEIWFGTNDGHIGALPTSGPVKQVEMPRPSSAVMQMIEAHNGIVCAGTAGTGLVFLDEATDKPTQTVKFDPLRVSGLAEDFIYALRKDKVGGIWIGHLQGVDYIPPSNGAFQSLLPSDTAPSALSGSHVTAIGTSADGKVWIGKENGVDLLTLAGDRFTLLQGKNQEGDKLPPALVYAIKTTADGTTWIATAQGLYQHQNGKLQRFQPLGDAPVRALLPDDGGLWIGLERRGLMRYDFATKSLVSFQHDAADLNSISDNFVLGLLRDPKHGLWIGTQHGLNLLDGSGFHSFFHDPANPDSLQSDTAIDLQLDGRGRLWIGTHGGGIAILDGEPLGQHRFLQIRQTDGLPNDNVGTLLTDLDGKIWVSTDSGIAKIDPDSLTAQSFTGADGLAVTANFINSGVRMPDGTLLFGGVGGATVIHPKRTTHWTLMPPVVATSIRIGQRDVPASRSVTLTPEDNSLQVEFAALDYTAPERNKYAYKLDGFERDWVSTDSDHRLAAYTNLPPGNYTLMLRGSNRAGLWADPPTRISVTVLPAWYQTWLFKAALAAIGILALVILVRSRTALLRRRQKELEGQVAQRTSEIASLLHNSGEGFLSFGGDLTIDRQYSKACEIFLGESPAGKYAPALLFAENPQHAAFLTESVPAALGSPNSYKRDLILSLLPKEIDRRGRRLKTHYAVLENGHLMVVLRDVSTERRLAERVASEHRRLGLIVAAVTDSRDFFDTLHAAQNFIEQDMKAYLASYETPALALQDVYRRIHTFKGEFNQFSFEKLPDVLHELEGRLDELRRSPETITRGSIEEAISRANLGVVLERDLGVVRKALGEDFLSKGGQVSMTLDQAAKIKSLADRWRRGEPIDLRQPAIRQLLDEIDKIGSISLRAALSSYDQTIAQVALRLEKEVAPLVILGNGDVWMDPDIFGPFLRSLIHVFRNCVVHGIEAPDKRIEDGKEEFGKIFCDITTEGDELFLVIADDGMGLNLDALRAHLVNSGLAAPEAVAALSDQAVADLIFQDHVSTSGETNQWAGRGIGLAAVRREVEALGGSVAVETHQGQGTRFLFRIKWRRQRVHQAAQ